MSNNKKATKTISVFKFFKNFPDEATAVKFIENQIWTNGAICPDCQSKRTAPRQARLGHRCLDCRKDFTVRNNTIFENSRMPLRTWLYAMLLTQTARKGISSLQLSKELGITQKSSWFMLQRIREACTQGDFKLSNIVEVDEVYIGGKETNKHQHKKLNGGRGAVGKAAVFGLKQRDGKTKAMAIDNTTKQTIQSNIQANVAQGSTVYSDDFRAYLGLSQRGFKHSAVNHSAKQFVNGMAHTNGIESVWAVLKRGYNGTFHHISIKHLQRYIDEFVFRLNEGNCRIDTMDRIKSLCVASAGKTLTYKRLIAS